MQSFLMYLFVDKFIMGEPDEPALVLHEWLKLNFLSINILSRTPYDTDNLPSGYCNIYIVYFKYIWLELSLSLPSLSKILFNIFSSNSKKFWILSSCFSSIIVMSYSGFV